MLTQAFTSAGLEVDDVVQFRSTADELLSEEDMRKPASQLFDRFKGESVVVDQLHHMAAGLGGLTKPSKGNQLDSKNYGG